MCINRSLVLLVPFVLYCSLLQQSHHVCTIIHSLSTNYKPINCPVFNGTSEHLSQMLKLWDFVALYSRYFKWFFKITPYVQDMATGHFWPMWRELCNSYNIAFAVVLAAMGVDRSTWDGIPHLEPQAWHAINLLVLYTHISSYLQFFITWDSHLSSGCCCPGRGPLGKVLKTAIE